MLTFMSSGGEFYSTLASDEMGEFLETGRLPGKLGVAQSLVEIWAESSQGTVKPLWVAKNGMRTAAVLRKEYLKWRNGDEGEESNYGKYRNWLNANEYSKLEVPGTFSQMLGAILEDIPPRLVAISDGVQAESRVVDGIEFVNECRVSTTNAYSNSFYADDVYSKTSTEDVVAWVQGQVWRRFNGSILLDVYTEKNLRKLVLLDMPPIGSYVAPPEDDSVHRMLATLPTRCKRFVDQGIPRNVLLYGPPGTGKSTLGVTLANKIGAERVLRVSGTVARDIQAQAVVDMVETLAPDVVVMDDIDRDKDMATRLLAQFDSTAHKTHVPIVIASVNSVGELDPALLRPGRFSETYEVVEPSDAHRLEIICHYVDKFGLSEDEEVLNLERVLQATEGFSPADVEELLKTLSVVGEDMLEPELERIAKQRGLYSGEACSEYLANGRRTVVDLSEMPSNY